MAVGFFIPKAKFSNTLLSPITIYWNIQKATLATTNQDKWKLFESLMRLSGDFHNNLCFKYFSKACICIEICTRTQIHRLVTYITYKIKRMRTSAVAKTYGPVTYIYVSLFRSKCYNITETAYEYALHWMICLLPKCCENVTWSLSYVTNINVPIVRSKCYCNISWIYTPMHSTCIWMWLIDSCLLRSSYVDFT